MSRRAGRSAIAAISLVSALLVAERAAVAQGSRRVDPSPAELAIAMGELDMAEEALYDRARRSPRDPSSRGTLGAFLAARGKFLVGATLLEEARFFGGDTVAIETRLAEVYRWTGRYGRIASLAAAPISHELRASMRAAGEAAPAGAASATVPLRPNELFGLGRITIVVGGETIEADIQPLSNGLVLPSTMSLFAAVEPSGGRGDTTFAVARSVAIGGVRFGPLPAVLVPSLRVATIGLDVLGQLHPTFDVAAGALTVRSGPYQARGERLPILLTFPGVSFVPEKGRAAVALHAAAGRAAVRGVRWTLGVASGALIVER